MENCWVVEWLVWGVDENSWQRRAIVNNSYHQGIPTVTVIVNSGWSKHALTSTPIMPSQELVNPLVKYYTWECVMDKFCYICSWHPEQPHPHNCFKTGTALLLPWKLTSLLRASRKVNNNMVSDMHHLLETAQVTQPYRVSAMGYSITKLECANHSLKCYYIVTHLKKEKANLQRTWGSYLLRLPRELLSCAVVRAIGGKPSWSWNNTF